MRLQHSLIFFLLSLLLIVSSAPAYARDIVATNFDAPSVDLTGVLERVESVDKEVVVSVPGGEGGRDNAMTVTAKGTGPGHQFVIFTLHNEQPLLRDFVLVSRWPGYVGSGLFWPDYGAAQILSIQASPGLQPQRLSTPQEDAFSLRLNAGETVTYAAELTGASVDNLSLWQRSAFDNQQQQLSFFRGVVLGIATLTAVFMLCLFIIRLQPAFPAAAVFAFASVAFIASEFGYLPLAASILPEMAGVEPRVRSLIECLMATGAIACLLTFLDLRRRAPSVGYPLLGVLGASVVLTFSAWFFPAVSMGLARLLLLTTAVAGFVIILLFWRRGMVRAQASLVTWSFLLLWTLWSFAAALGWIGLDLVGPVLAWGLVLVLLTMAFTLTQFAFNQGVINSRFFEDSGRRGLALAGAEQIVWDWNEEQGALFVGPELERVLGHAQGRISRGGLKGWLELVHPGDRNAYVGVIENAVQRGRGTFSQDFRLRRGDGTYRWYQLRARSLPGEHGRAARCIGTLSDVTARKRSEEHLLFDAVRDRVTNLPNRALFIDRLDRAMRRADATASDALYLLVVDLDRFKHVNDSLGFAVGDSLLLTVARRLATLCATDDTLGRLTGDRFGIIVDTRRGGRQIDSYIDHLRSIIAKPIPLKPQEVFLTASIGIVRYEANKSRAEDLLKDAEIALYEAKRQGKDSAITFAASMRDTQPRLLNLEEDLRYALDRNQIEVAYQPVMRLHDRKLAGFEALVRWRHEVHGTLEPSAFIQLAEETGLLNELGRFVLNQAARQLGIWQRAYRSDEALFMTVNVSSRELINRNLIDEVKTVLSREDLVPGTLKLELTETILMENPELSIMVLERLQQAGVGIACDDFGTGYSAMAHLRRLPFDTIKIDRCFLDGDPDDDAAQIILEAIVLLAHDLGMDTVIEGIESADQADRLRDLGCDFGQGFHFGEPMSARQVMESFGGSQSIGGRLGKDGIASASFWQRIIKRGEDLKGRADVAIGSRDDARSSKAVAPSMQIEDHEKPLLKATSVPPQSKAQAPGSADAQDTFEIASGRGSVLRQPAGLAAEPIQNVTPHPRPRAPGLSIGNEAPAAKEDPSSAASQALDDTAKDVKRGGFNVHIASARNIQPGTSSKIEKSMGTALVVQPQADEAIEQLSVVSVGSTAGTEFKDPKKDLAIGELEKESEPHKHQQGLDPAGDRSLLIVPSIGFGGPHGSQEENAGETKDGSGLRPSSRNSSSRADGEAYGPTSTSEMQSRLSVSEGLDKGASNAGEASELSSSPEIAESNILQNGGSEKLNSEDQDSVLGVSLDNPHPVSPQKESETPLIHNEDLGYKSEEREKSPGMLSSGHNEPKSEPDKSSSAKNVEVQVAVRDLPRSPMQSSAESDIVAQDPAREHIGERPQPPLRRLLKRQRPVNRL
ncbi:diguanylate cyclase (GGDEF)-like protein/PAS domain S-box-containing protein [Rhodoligotrophos appendicifer]|uniref:putative bifunctional diguanylate cyclase/phosphodiesterase n=1 Tax=Rhodoligotrophos appendicifer TaxID=987056 RepID=UPI00147873F4|nr:EAL domain-containing protein [Rhodoligotrophos appendicifer]